MKNKELSSILSYGIIKERTAALFTDAMRANLLEYMGYKTQILEFIDMEHTPKKSPDSGSKDKKATKEAGKMAGILSYGTVFGLFLDTGKFIKRRGHEK